jgi:nucleotide-binding universal stress UspA family protein
MAHRLDAHLRVVVPVGGKRIDVVGVRADAPGLATVVEERGPVGAIVDACGDDTDLAVVGTTRGRTGIGALTSVGAKLAHEVGCSVLLVRGR